MENGLVKTCKRCVEEKPLSDFYKHKVMKDGHRSNCKACMNADHETYRKENPDIIKEIGKRSSKRQKESGYIKNYYDKNKLILNLKTKEYHKKSNYYQKNKDKIKVTSEKHYSPENKTHSRIKEALKNKPKKWKLGE